MPPNSGSNSRCELVVTVFGLKFVTVTTVRIFCHYHNAELSRSAKAPPQSGPPSGRQVFVPAHTPLTNF